MTGVPLKSYNVLQVPAIHCIQKISIYETQTRFYLVGSNSAETRFRVLKIDRTELKKLSVIDDQTEYSKEEVEGLLDTIQGGNKAGLKKLTTAYAIVGFITFLEGWYVVVVTKKRKIAEVGIHVVYKVEDTSTIYLPQMKKSSQADEARYLKTFQNVDLSSNFYFSYSYDLSNTLQHNLLPSKLTPDVIKKIKKIVHSDEHDVIANNTTKNTSVNNNNKTYMNKNRDTNNSSKNTNNKTTTSNTQNTKNKHTNTSTSNKKHNNNNNKHTSSNDNNNVVYLGTKGEPCWDYVWNEYLLQEAINKLHSDWIVPIIHGFVGQSSITIFNKDISVTLVARRSNRFAGTRFLKRGTNMQGYVANEVETEQIVFDDIFLCSIPPSSSSSSPSFPAFSSSFSPLLSSSPPSSIISSRSTSTSFTSFIPPLHANSLTTTTTTISSTTPSATLSTPFTLLTQTSATEDSVPEISNISTPQQPPLSSSSTIPPLSSSIPPPPSSSQLHPSNTFPSFTPRLPSSSNHPPFSSNSSTTLPPLSTTPPLSPTLPLYSSTTTPPSVPSPSSSTTSPSSSTDLSPPSSFFTTPTLPSTATLNTTSSPSINLIHLPSHPFFFTRFTSFCQLRGSIPLAWSQSLSRMVPKPVIHLDQRDPYYVSTGKHFNRLLHRYGTPVIVLDLVKKEEKVPQESLLSEEFTSSISFLNQFLPSQHRIQYIPCDMANINKASSKTFNVLFELEEIADYCVFQTSFFHNHPPLHTLNPLVLSDDRKFIIARNMELFRSKMATSISSRWRRRRKRKSLLQRSSSNNDFTHGDSGANHANNPVTHSNNPATHSNNPATHSNNPATHSNNGSSKDSSNDGYSNVFNASSVVADVQGGLQCGVVRTNCIDCLDRTNTAQYVLAVKALARQLYSLGVLSDLKLNYDSDCMKMMEELYEEHGDTLALQYGGSQLVHRIKGYRKLTPWMSSSRDIMHSLSRYYSNTFSDSEKQNSINLFLGVFRPDRHHTQAPLWNLNTDFYLHNQQQLSFKELQKRRKNYTMWWDEHLMQHLPFPFHHATKTAKVKVMSTSYHGNEELDLTMEYYKPHQVSLFAESVCFNVLNSARDFTPRNSVDQSPFCLRVRRQSKQKNSLLNSSANNSSPCLHNSASLESIGSRKEADDESKVAWKKNSYDSLLFDTTEETATGDPELQDHPSSILDTSQLFYGLNIQPPNQADRSIYQRYARNELLESCFQDNNNTTANVNNDNNNIKDDNNNIKNDNINIDNDNINNNNGGFIDANTDDDDSYNEATTTATTMATRKRDREVDKLRWFSCFIRDVTKQQATFLDNATATSFHNVTTTFSSLSSNIPAAYAPNTTTSTATTSVTSTTLFKPVDSASLQTYRQYVARGSMGGEGRREGGTERDRRGEEGTKMLKEDRHKYHTYVQQALNDTPIVTPTLL